MPYELFLLLERANIIEHELNLLDCRTTPLVDIVLFELTHAQGYSHLFVDRGAFSPRLRPKPCYCQMYYTTATPNGARPPPRRQRDEQTTTTTTMSSGITIRRHFAKPCSAPSFDRERSSEDVRLEKLALAVMEGQKEYDPNDCEGLLRVIDREMARRARLSLQANPQSETSSTDHRDNAVDSTLGKGAALAFDRDTRTSEDSMIVEERKRVIKPFEKSDRERRSTSASTDSSNTGRSEQYTCERAQLDPGMLRDKAQERMRYTVERALARVEVKHKHRAWARDVIGPAIKAAIDECYAKVMKQRDEEREEVEEMMWRRRLELIAKSTTRKRAAKPTEKRTVVIGRKKTTKVEEVIPEPTYVLPRKIDLLAQEEGVPLPTRQQQPFRLARPNPSWASQLRQEVLSGENDFGAERHDIGPRVDDDDARFISHSEWERILAATPKRRQVQQQPVETEQGEHSTGVFATVKTWAKSLWGKVKSALWG